jgi:hypothetical protein
VDTAALKNQTEPQIDCWKTEPNQKTLIFKSSRTEPELQKPFPRTSKYYFNT